MSAAYTTVTASNNQVTLSINGLSNPFTSKYYNMVAWTTDGGQPDSTKSNILATKRAGDTTSITLSLDEVKENWVLEQEFMDGRKQQMELGTPAEVTQFPFNN